MKRITLFLLLCHFIAVEWALITWSCGSWSRCSKSCGGGTKKRKCSKDFFDSKTERKDCNEFCRNGHSYSSGSCRCPSYRTGECCESCRHIYIPNCVSGYQVCGGSPDNIRCILCGDAYYPSGWGTASCKACPAIHQCKHRSCTNTDNTVCLECNENKTIFVPSPDQKSCERICAWNNHYCWPGTCGDGLTKNCQCHPDFQLVSQLGADIDSGETTCQPSKLPTILTCDTVLVGSNGEKKRAMSSGNSTACEYLQDMYGNFQPSIAEFKMSSEYTITGLDSFLKPTFIQEENFGISDTTIVVKRKLLSGTLTDISTHALLTDSSSSANVQRKVDNSGNVTITSKTYNVANGEGLCLSFEAQGGGFLKSIDTSGSTHQISASVPYTKITKLRQVCYHFDNAPPEHCANLLTCQEEPLSLNTRITRSTITAVTFGGWTDPIPSGGTTNAASSIESYQITVNEVMPSKGILKVDTAVVFTEKMNHMVTSMTLNLTSDTPKLYSVTLEVKDVADNVRQARRFFLYDDTTSIETVHDKPFVVTSASPLTNYNWQTHHNDICLSWKDHFINKFYFDNELLSPIEADPHGLISGVYEQETGLLPVDGTPNVFGIVNFKISWSLDSNILSSPIYVPEFLNETFCNNFSLNDGETYTFNLQPVDIAENVFNETRTVYIDRSVPHINNIWLKKDGYKMLFVHDSTDLSQMQMTFEALDPHSGVQIVEWTFGIADTSTELTSGALAVARLNNETCSSDSTVCYCPKIGDCEYLNYTIPLSTLVTADKHTGNHNRNYYFTITVTNRAMLSNTEHVDVLVDNSPPEAGVVYEGPIGGKDIDYINGDSFITHWHGFIDHESGIRLYRIGLSTRCLVKEELYNFTSVPDVSFYNDVSATEMSLFVPANFTGKRYITVIALNNAMEPSDPVCSDGITRDLSPPELRNFTIEHATWSESIICDNDIVWLMHSSMAKIRLLNTSKCADLCRTERHKTVTAFLPTHILIEKDSDNTDFLCSTLPYYTSETVVYLPSDHIVLRWDIEETGSQVEDCYVGFGFDANEDSPGIVDYKSTNKKTEFKRRHEGIGSDDMFYIFIKLVNKAGLEKITTIGPVLIDETPPLYTHVPNVTVTSSDIIVGWDIDTFFDNEQREQIDQIYFQIENDEDKASPLLEWRLHSSPPCPEYNGGCFKYPTARLQKQDTDLGLSFSIIMYVYNNAGHATVVSTDAFKLPSSYPPGHAVIYDIDPTNTIVDTDIDVHFSRGMICARWHGFEHHESLLLEFGVGTTNNDDNVLSFHEIHYSKVYCTNSTSLCGGVRYFSLVRATSSGGTIISASNGVMIMDSVLLDSSIQISLGKSCLFEHDFEQTILLLNKSVSVKVDHQMRIGQTYLLSIYNSTSAASVIIDSDDAYILNRNPLSISIVPVKEHPYLTMFSSQENVSIKVRLTACPVQNSIQYDNSLAVSWDFNLTSTHGLRYLVGVYLVNNTVKSNTETIVVPYRPTQTAMNYTFKDIEFQEGSIYEIGLKICSKLICLPPKTSNQFKVDIFPPRGLLVNAKLTSNGPESCAGIVVNWTRFDTSVEILFYQWTIAKYNNGEHMLTDWETFLPINGSTYQVKSCVTLPVHGQATMFVCVRAFTVSGRSGMTCGDIDVTYVQYGSAAVYDIDMTSSSWQVIVQALPSSNVGDLLRIIHNNELDFGTRQTEIAGAMLYTTDRNVTWNLMTSRHVPNNCDLDIHCKSSHITSNGYVKFSSIDIEINAYYYICAFSRATTMSREYFSEVLTEISSCSNGFVIDESVPVPEKLYVKNVSNYITNPRDIFVSWNAFEENINSTVLGYAHQIKTYSFGIGSLPGGDDIVPTTIVRDSKSTVSNLGNIEDGSIVYVTVIGTNHANLSSSSTSGELIIDASSPITGTVIIDNSGYSRVYINDNAVRIRLCEFRDPHSGIAYFNVGIGSHDDLMDILEPFQIFADSYILSLDGLLLPDGHQYYILVQAVNRAGLVSEPVAVKFTVDKTPPSGGHVLDGSWKHKKDKDFQTEMLFIEGHWTGFTDPHSGIYFYRAGLGTRQYKNDVRPLTDVGLRKDITWNGSFIPGEKYFITVEACNLAGLCTSRSSDGLIIDTSPPVKGIVNVGPDTGHHKYLPHAGSIQTQWVGFEDPQSDIEHFEACVGTRQYVCDVVMKFNTLLSSKVIKSNITMPQETPLFVTVWVFNRVGLNSSKSSDSFMVHQKPPTIVRKPEFLLDYNSVERPNLFGQWERSILRIFWEFQDNDCPIVSHQVSLVTHHGGHTPIEHMHLGSETNLTINLDENNCLYNGDTYYVAVTGCNAAGLCSTERSVDILIDSSPPHLGGFKYPLLWNNFNDSNGAVGSNITLTWYGFHDQESDIDTYFVTVSRSYSNHELSNGVVSFESRGSMDLQSASLKLVNVLQPDELVILSIWAQNRVGLNSSVARVTVNTLSTVRVTDIVNERGHFEIEKHSCDVHFCNKDCTCAVIGKPCAEVVVNATCTELNHTEVSDRTLPTFSVYGGLPFNRLEISASSACLAGHWIRDMHITTSEIHRFEWSIGIQHHQVGEGIFDLNSEQPWQDVALRTEFIYCLPMNRSLIHDTLYVVYLRAWYGPSTYSLYKSNAILLDHTPPDVRKGRYIVEGDITCSDDKDFIDWMNTITACWGGVFSEQQGRITQYIVALGTAKNSDDVYPAANVALDTNITISNMTLQHNTRYYFSVTAVNNVGLHTRTSSDGFVVDMGTPTSGSIFNTLRHKDREYQAQGNGISFSWHGFQDNVSGIKSYFVALTTKDTFNETDLSFVNVGLLTRYRFRSEPLIHGQTYFGVVKVIDAAGHMTSPTISRGVTIDVTPPMGYRCNKFNELDIDILDTVNSDGFITKTAKARLTKSTLYNLHGVFESNISVSVILNIDRLRIDLPLSRNHDGSFECTYNFLPDGSDVHNISMRVYGSTISQSTWSFTLKECGDSEEDTYKAVVVRQFGPDSISISTFVVDEESKIKAVKIGAGNTHGGFQVQSLAVVHDQNYNHVIQVDRQHGSLVFVTVIVENHAGLTSVFYPAPITIDHTPPELNNIHVRYEVELETTNNSSKQTVTVHTSWESDEDKSGVNYCLCSIGTQSGLADITTSWMSDTSSSCTSDKLNPVHGDQLYVTVKCVNHVELSATISSNPIVISLEPPTVDDASVGFLTINDISTAAFANELVQHAVQSNTSCIQIHWEGFEDRSGVHSYEYRLRDENNVVVDWHDAGAMDMASMNRLNLPPDSNFTADVRAVNSGMYKSTSIQRTITIATQAPLLSGAPVKAFRQEKILHIDWGRVFHLVSGVPVSFSVAIGSRLGLTDILDITYTSGYVYDVTIPESTLISPAILEFFIYIKCAYSTGLSTVYTTTYTL